MNELIADPLWREVALFAGLTAACVGALSLLVFSACRRESWDVETTPEHFRVLRRSYERVLRAMKDMEFDFQAGTISKAEYDSLRAQYKEFAISARRALDRSRIAAVRRIAAGKSVSLSGDEKQRLDALVRAARKKESRLTDPRGTDPRLTGGN